jgi:hypothetical protein
VRPCWSHQNKASALPGTVYTRASALGMHKRKSGLDCVRSRQNMMGLITLKAHNLDAEIKSNHIADVVA